MDRKTNCTVSVIVRIHQMKPGLVVTQKNVNGSGLICSAKRWHEFQRINCYCPVCCKEKQKMAEICDAKKKEKENIDIYENIVAFIELKCLHKCSQLYEWNILEINLHLLSIIVTCIA